MVKIINPNPIDEDHLTVPQQLFSFIKFLTGVLVETPDGATVQQSPVSHRRPNSLGAADVGTLFRWQIFRPLERNKRHSKRNDRGRFGLISEEIIISDTPLNRKNMIGTAADQLTDKYVRPSPFLKHKTIKMTYDYCVDETRDV
ncbi:hypothetical protein GWI33_013982 [Rhynchophorus ferrugineus]|uniref:Uncharacterized protein n=1 Tax=Rhynchophorus ferrugineus TaxID=354439 RepID=A0A834I860_RHYFE|nr:hypothetical protein GWI33_013982 [Rhynchophorus ferrugineus]